MSGYIEYDNTSVFSPAYISPIEIDDISYRSPLEAIEDGHDPDSVLLQHVYEHRDIYFPYRNYTFQGIYSDSINKAIKDIIIPRIEPITIGKYIYMLGDIDIPRGVPILRYTYLLSHVKGNIYKQTHVLDAIDRYDVHLIDGNLLYTGDDGSFLLMNNIDDNVEPIVNRLKG